jgi:uncharacterized membrane-anchored protein
MTWLIYLLSIIDSVSIFFGVSGFLTVLVSGIWAIACLSDFTSYSTKMQEEKRPAFWKAIRVSKIAGTVGIILMVIGVLVPDKRDLIQAYLMVEGRKVANVEQVEEIVDGVMKRVDRVIDNAKEDLK